MARRRRSKRSKWIVTGVLTAALAGGVYAFTMSGDDAARRMMENTKRPPAVTRNVQPRVVTPPVQAQRASVQRPAAAKPQARPIAPLAMPTDAPHRVAVPRPALAVGD